MVLFRVAVLLVAFSLLSGTAQAQTLPGFSGFGPFPESLFYGIAPPSDVPTYRQSICLRKYINSFTSYQFPNPFPPGQDPLSRLEFPIDQWFVGLLVEHRAAWWALGAQASANLSRNSASRMQDSDWDDETDVSQKTIFSESRCRLNRGRLFDAYLVIGPPQRTLFSVRPLIGYRYQYFFFTTHDGYQAEISGGASDLPGDGIDFEQIFSHLYFGAVSVGDINLNGILPHLPSVRVSCQIDYAAVRALNEDLHLMRAGERITTENTRGHCWHGALGIGIRVRDTINFWVAGDFKRIKTNGSHQLTNRLLGVDFSFDGSNVWSDQASLSAGAEFAF